MSGIVKVSSLMQSQCKPLKIVAAITEKASSVAKTGICAVGSLFQAIKILLKVPFTVVLAPAAIGMDKIGKFFNNQTMINIAEGMGLGFSKDLIMMIRLVDFTCSDKKDYSCEDTLSHTARVVLSTHECYNLSARVLWSNYIYAKDLPSPVRDECN